MAEKIFIADKATLDKVDAAINDVRTDIDSINTQLANLKLELSQNEDYLTKDTLSKYVVGSTGTMTNATETLMLHVPGPGYLYMACVCTQVYSINSYLKVSIDNTPIETCSATSPSSDYNAIAGLCHTQLINSYRYTVGTGTAHYTFLNTARGPFMVNDHMIGRSLSSNQGVRGISTLIKPIRFEESLDIYSHSINSTGGNNSYILQYAYLLD